ncbi:MAG: hypothetical protein WDM87_05905 [Terracidiphilus sp.]
MSGSSSKRTFHGGMGFTDLVENRSGVIAVDARGTVYGGGAYDGHFNIDPMNDTNGIFRAYAIPGLHPNPKNVLIIGLSSGSWAQILANDQQVEDVTIVEINPGYPQLIRERPTIVSLLTNPNVHIVIDDGRRWACRAPGSQVRLHFDEYDIQLAGERFKSPLCELPPDDPPAPESRRSRLLQHNRLRRGATDRRDGFFLMPCA